MASSSSGPQVPQKPNQPVGSKTGIYSSEGHKAGSRAASLVKQRQAQRAEYEATVAAIVSRSSSAHQTLTSATKAAKPKVGTLHARHEMEAIYSSFTAQIIEGGLIVGTSTAPAAAGGASGSASACV